MSNRPLAAVLMVWCLISGIALQSVTAVQQGPTLLGSVGTVRLPHVKGRIDHLAYDGVRRRLFVAALGNDSVEVIDAANNTHIRSLTGFHEPQGMAFVPDLAAVAVANGATGTLQLIDAQSLAIRWTIPLGGDADNVRLDAAAKRLYVAAEGGLFAVDAAAGKSVGRIAFDGHPESFQLESRTGRVFANLPGLLRSEVVVSDRTSMKVAARWTAGCGSNYPMTLDESTGRVFIGCRRPALLSVLDTRSGATATSLAIVGDTDDIFYDEARRRVYVIGGEGFIDVVARDGDRLTRGGRVDTRPGTRTGLWVGALSRLYAAVPARGSEPAEVRVFEARDTAP
jgi:DNA-binding beta-propeller fold protein YncE